MSNDDPYSSPSGKPPTGGEGGHPLGGGGANTKALTPQELRVLRLAKFEGGGSGSGRSAGKAPERKAPPPTTGAPATAQATGPLDTSLKEPPIYSNDDPSRNNSSSRSKPAGVGPPQAVEKPKKPDPPASLLRDSLLLGATVNISEGNNNIDVESNDTSESGSNKKSTGPDPAPIIDAIVEPLDRNGDGSLTALALYDNSSDMNQTRSVGPNTAPTFEAMVGTALDQEDDDLQTAIALSMGLPVPPRSKSAFTIDPLPAYESEQENQPASLVDDLDLTTAAMVVATSPEVGASPPSTAPSTPMNIESMEDNDVVMEGDDRKPAAIPKPAVPAMPSPSRILRTNPQHFSGRVRTWYETATAYNVLDFHDCMWDKDATTEHDKKRWLAQGIQFKDEHDDRKTPAGTITATSDIMDSSTLLATIISGPGVWCLTQQHGGPCGVLASIQAELLRILLFGPRTIHPMSMITIDFPNDLTNEFTKAAPDMSRQKMRQVLALSMGMILARASLMPAANLQDDNNTDNGSSHSGDSNAAVLVENGNGHSGDSKDSVAVLVPLPIPTVRLILPKNKLWDTTSCLEWQHLEPWNSGDGGSFMSEHLLSYTISLKKSHSSFNDDDTIPITNSAVKRQKRSDCDLGFDEICKELAHATAQFLLETNSLNWFQRPGGVLLMVMSIAASRGIPKTQGDMDDMTAKLTSTFGHCSQELTNLLLTGQAVSNVFDHTLRPSGELVCRGVQSQSTIGYLTQLEAMRYLEVGGFYKTPRFPIWVVGSTSHFSVMFGDANALKESASDVLLEKVRRTFKRMEGGAAENGFIQTNQLGDFLKSLDYNVTSDPEVQILAAFMDKYGAGIVLWEDLWKTTSRLLTGASVVSILDGTDEATNNSSNSNNSVISQNPAMDRKATTLTQMSDEELARKMQAEWNGEDVVLSGSSLSRVFDSDSTTPVANVSVPSQSIAPTEKFGRTFQMYHYNGLRGGIFKVFRVTRLSADEAIGASIALASSNQSTHNGMGFGGEMSAVLRTKWPSCKIDWLNGSPPSLD